MLKSSIHIRKIKLNLLLLSIFTFIIPSCKDTEDISGCDSVEVTIINQTSYSNIFIQVNAGSVSSLSDSMTVSVDVGEFGYGFISANLVNSEFGWVEKEISGSDCQPKKCIWKDSDF